VLRSVYIHLGLHKTASTFLQKQFFPLFADQCGYVSLRTDLRAFLDYILYSHDFDFDAGVALQLLSEGLSNCGHDGDVLTISDEQFCGSPWDNARDRRRYFDRLFSCFPGAKFIIVFRNQEEMTKSLYLQYVKTGGAASSNQFLTFNRPPLEFARGAYLDYGSYVDYILAIVKKKDSLKCLFYEDMKVSPQAFFNDLAGFIGFEILLSPVSNVANKTENKSLSAIAVPLVRFFNKLFASPRDPFLLVPSKLRAAIVKTVIFIFPRSRKDVLDLELLNVFCQESKRKNEILSKAAGRSIQAIGY